MIEWDFPNGQNLTPKGVNNSSIEIFLDNIAESLTREVIQNSVDAHNDELESPVRVTFDFLELSTEDIPGIKGIKEEALPKAVQLWEEKNNVDTIKFLNRFKKVLYAENVRVLKISDYNTTGLNNKKYESLILGDGYSEKDNRDSAGSKGIGKAAPFAASDLRMVFYNTLSTQDGERSVGIINFVSFVKQKEGNYITQERASYVDQDKGYIPTQLSFGGEDRKPNEYGTDLFIMGIKEFNRWKENIILSTVNNFLVSILQDKLEVEVEEIKINKDTIHQVIEDILNKNELKGDERAEFQKTFRFYDALTNKDSLKFDLDERFKKYSFVKKTSDAQLVLLQHEPANRTVLQTRIAGMKIYERNRISGNINFTGVFQAIGKDLNEFLKDLENANHDTWSIDRKQGVEREEAAQFLTDLLHWYKEKVRESFADLGTNEIEAFGVNDLLPLQQDESEVDEKPEDSGIKNKFEDFSIKRKKATSQTLDADKEEELLEDLIKKEGIGDGENAGSGGQQGGSGGGDNTDSGDGKGQEKGDKGEGKDKGVVTENEKRVGPSDVLSLKIIEINAKHGKYRLLGTVKKKRKKIEVELKSIGANGAAYPLKILEVSSDGTDIECNKNIICLLNAKQKPMVIVDFTIDSKLRLKMEGTVYEVKG